MKNYPANWKENLYLMRWNWICIYSFRQIYNLSVVKGEIFVRYLCAAVVVFFIVYLLTPILIKLANKLDFFLPLLGFLVLQLL